MENMRNYYNFYPIQFRNNEKMKFDFYWGRFRVVIDIVSWIIN